MNIYTVNGVQFDIQGSDKFQANVRNSLDFLNLVSSTHNDIVDYLSFSSDNTLWVATNKGLKEIQVSHNGINTGLKRVYEVKDGLPGEEIHCVLANEKEVLIKKGISISAHPFYYKMT